MFCQWNAYIKLLFYLNLNLLYFLNLNPSWGVIVYPIIFLKLKALLRAYCLSDYAQDVFGTSGHYIDFLETHKTTLEQKNLDPILKAHFWPGDPRAWKLGLRNQLKSWVGSLCIWLWVYFKSEFPKNRVPTPPPPN